MSSRATARDTRSPTASRTSRAGAIRRMTPSTLRRVRSWSGDNVAISWWLPAALVEVELRQGGLGDLGGDLLGLVQVSRAHRQVVDGHDAHELLAIGHRQAADAVLDHQRHRLLDVHLYLARDQRARGVVADKGVRLHRVRHHREREIAIGYDADRSAGLAHHDRADVTVAHELADAVQAVARLGGHYALGHYLADAHGATVSSPSRPGTPSPPP